MEAQFCTRLSRLFSGEVAALFAPDAQLYSVSATLDAALSSPFRFQLDTEIAQYTQFWNITRLQLQIFAATGIRLTNYVGAHTDRFYLCPNNNVGQNAISPAGDVSNFQPINVGIGLVKSQRQAQQNTLAFLSVSRNKPVIVPPGWFLRYVLLDNDGGPNFLPAGTKISLVMFRQIIDVKFATGGK